MSRSAESNLVTLAVLGLSLLAAPAQGDSVPLWDLQRDLLKLESTNEVLQRELDRLGKSSGKEDDSLDPELRKYLFTKLTDGSRHKEQRERTAKSLAELNTGLKTEGDTLAKSYRKTWEQRLAVVQREAEFRARYECEPGEVPPLLPRGASLARLAVWGGLLALVGVLLLLRRLSVQRRPRWLGPPLLARLARWAVVALIVVVLGGACWLWFIEPAGSLWPWARLNPDAIGQQVVERERQSLAGAIQSAERKQERLATELDRVHARPAPLDAESIRTLQQEMGKELREALVQARLNQKLDEQQSLLRDEVEKRSRKILDEETRHSDRLSWRGQVRAGLYLSFLVVALLPWLSVFRVKNRVAPSECPCCAPGTELRHSASGQLECVRCSYILPPPFETLPPVCFAALGWHGKTRWLIEAQQQIERENVPAAVVLRSVETSEAARLDRAAEAMRRGENLAPTSQAGEPLLWDFHERQASERALVHLFDLSGDGREQRALAMDGLLVFLDPAQPWDEQRRTLGDLLAELRQARDAPRGPSPIPVAICLSLAERLDQEEIPPWLDRLADTMRSRVELSLLAERSELVAREVYGTAEAGSWLQSRFGDNYLFFPIKTSGIAEEPLAPFGTLEPVLWLLHRNGFRVFE
jgi:hypothetical protein